MPDHAKPPRLALVLGGGNALAAYHAGVYQALDEAGWEPAWIVGTSAGAITGALIAGNARSDRLSRLEDFWRPTSSDGDAEWWTGPGETMRRTAAVTATLATGRPGLFGPIGPFGSWWSPDALAAAPSLYDLKPLRDSLARLVDWDRLNDGTVRFTATAVDLETGEDVVFDTTRDRLGADHVRASGALLPTFPPVEIEGRVLADGGLSLNVPIDPVLAEPPPSPTLCIAVDLLPLARPTPQTLGEAIGRAQDLAFATQTRRAVAHWQVAYRADPALAAASVTLATLTYADQDREVAGKGMDFSPATVRARWNAGLTDARALVERWNGGGIAVGAPGLTIARAHR